MTGPRSSYTDATRPISPDDVDRAKCGAIPGEIFSAFNTLIAATWNGREAYVKQKDVVAQALANLKVRLPDVTADEIYKQAWLNVEPAYTAAGWRVEYDKPAYNETYDAVFYFRRRA